MTASTRRLPWIVISGGPCSGKTKLYHEIVSRMPTVLGIPELATVLTRDIGVLRSDDPLVYRKPLWQMQRVVESAFFHMTDVLDDVSAVVLDSASVCNAGFLMGGTSQMKRMFGTTLRAEYARYDHIIWLSPAPRRVFEREKKSNPSRIESRECAAEIGHAMFQAWAGHPGFHPVILDRDDWQSKSRQAWCVLDDIWAGRAE